MFTPALALLAGAALARAAGLKISSTSPYGQNAANITLHQIRASPAAYVLNGGLPADLTTSAVVDGGALRTICPRALEAVLVPVAGADPAEYTVELVAGRAGLPEGTIVGGWSTSDDKIGLANPDFTKVVNAIGGKFDIDRSGAFGADVFPVKWVNASYLEHGAYYQGWYIVLDGANDVACIQ
ncbi:hypothetical protein HDZ31DRAFT_61923 [Schizophyllum fasciatum]